MQRHRQRGSMATQLSDDPFAEFVASPAQTEPDPFAEFVTPELTNEQDAAANNDAARLEGADMGDRVVRDDGTTIPIGDASQTKPKLSLPTRSEHPAKAYTQPSNLQVAGNAFVKGVASVPDMFAGLQPTNFVRMAGDYMQGKPVTLMPTTAQDLAQGIGAINPAYEPQTEEQRYIDAAGKGVGAGLVGGVPMGIKSAAVSGASGVIGNVANQYGVEKGHPILGAIGGVLAGGATGVGLGKMAGVPGAVVSADDAAYANKGAALTKADEVMSGVSGTLKAEGIDLDALPNTVRNNVKEYVANAMINGNASLDDVTMAARQAILKSLRKPMTGTQGQLSNKYVQQDSERVIADTWMGGPLRNKFESDSPMLIENLDAIKSATGGKAESANEFGRALRGTVKGKSDASMQNVRDSYAKAKEEVGDISATLGDDALAWMKENKGVTGVDSLVSKAKGMGAVVERTLDDGTTVFEAQPIPIKKLSDLRSFASKSSKDGGTAGYMAGGLKGMVDDAIESQGGELYKNAANLRRQHALTYESGPKVVSGILKGKQGSETDLAIANEKIFNNSIVNGSIDDVKNLYGFLLKGDRNAGMSQIKNVRAMTTEYLKQAATKDGNSETFMMGAFENAIKKLGGDDKIRAIYGEKGLKEINNFKSAAQILQKQRASAAKGSQTTSRLANLLPMLEKALDKIPVVGAPISKVAEVSRQAYMARNAMVDPIQEAAKEAAKKARKTPLSDLQNLGIVGASSAIAPEIAGKNYMVDR